MKRFNRKSDQATNNTILYLLVLLFIVLAVLIAGSKIISSDSLSVSSQLPEPTRINKPHDRVDSPDQSSTKESQKIRRYFAQEKSDPRVHSSELREILNEFDRLESARCHMLRVTTPAGATNYYLKALPPSREEVATVRSLIAATLEKAPPEKRSMLDDSIGRLIKEYDPFGQTGSKLISIRVPDDQSKPLAAWVFSTTNADQDLEKLLSGEMTTAPDTMRFYVSDPGKPLFRFRNLFVD